MYPTERCKIKTHAHELTGKIRIHVYELVDQESGKTRAYEQKDQVETNQNTCLRGDGSQHESTREIHAMTQPIEGKIEESSK